MHHPNAIESNRMPIKTEKADEDRSNSNRKDVAKIEYVVVAQKHHNTMVGKNLNFLKFKFSKSFLMTFFFNTLIIFTL